MSFGYLPHKTLWKDILLKIFGWPNMIRRLQAPIIMRMLDPKKNDVILDAGCGGGQFSFEIAKRSKYCVGIDININQKNSSNLLFIKGDVQRMPFKRESFNKVLLSSVLQMVEDDKTLLKECFRVLKEKGILVLSVPIGYIHFKTLNNLKPWLKEKFGALGKGYYDLDEVMKMLETEGFEIMEVEYAPKKWGSLIFEATLFLWYRFGIPYSSPFLFPVLYPIAYLDKYANRKQKGNEVIIKAKKV